MPPGVRQSETLLKVQESMSKKFEPIRIDPKDLVELAELVEGAQKFMAPAEDPQDEERLPKIDPNEQSLTS